MKKIKRFLGFIVLIVFIFIGIILYGGYSKYRIATDNLSVVDASENIKSIENYTYIQDVPQIYINSIIAVEDRRFYYHGGFDVLGILRAVVTDIKKGELVEGGSTITQQLAKNIYFVNDNSLERKIAEIFVAIDLEKNFEKDEILELYMNGIYYGSGYYNIYDASMGYFNKIPSHISDYEATMLAGIINAPSVYSLKNNPELASERQEKVLDNLVDLKYITKEEKNKILSN